MKNILLFASTLCLFGCASATPPADPEYVAVARVALGDTERAPSMRTIVAGPDISAKAKGALVALGRSVIAPDAVAPTAPAANYLYLSKFDVVADNALFESMTGASVKACGVGSKVAMSRKSGAWAVINNTVSICSDR